MEFYKLVFIGELAVHFVSLPAEGGGAVRRRKENAFTMKFVIISIIRRLLHPSPTGAPSRREPVCTSTPINQNLKQNLAQIPTLRIALRVRLRPVRVILSDGRSPNRT